MTKPSEIKVLVACEESQTVCKAFRERGFEAYSCDIQECSGGSPEWHLQMDIFEAIKLKEWDLMIAHPPCTYMSKAGARWMYPKAGILCESRYKQAMDANFFFMRLLATNIKHIAIENPFPLRVVGLPRHTQAIQPYEYGHEFSKKTLLLIKNLPELTPTCIMNHYIPYLPSNTGGAKRGQKYTPRNISQKDASKTFPGIARAMAEQWGDYILNN